jgi:hypothetical protein
LGQIVYRVSCPWGGLFMGKLSMGHLSLGPVVPRTSCLWGDLSLGPVVYGTRCPGGEVSIREAVMERIVMGRVPWGEVLWGQLSGNQLSLSSCPYLAALSFPSCPGYLILVVLCWQPCPISPVPAVMSGNPVLPVLSSHFCSTCPLLPV